MSKNGLFVIVVFLMLAASCRSSQSSVLESGLSAYVPSDACAVFYCNNASSAQELIFGPEEAMAKLDLTGLKHKEMLVSCHYYGEMEALLLLQLDKSSKGQLSKASAALMEEAASLGLQSLQLDDVLLLSESASLLSSASRHVSENASIKDVPAVQQALALGKKDAPFYAVVRNSSLRYIFPKEKKFLANLIDRPRLLSYFDAFSSYLFISLDAVEPVIGGEYVKFSIQPLVTDSLRQYSAFVEQLPLKERALDKYIVSGCESFMYESVGSDEDYFAKRKQWLDANSLLKSFEKSSRTVRKELGKSPKEWARSLGIDQIAKIKSRGQSILALHCSNRPDSLPLHKKGLAALLYGQEFALKDESSLAMDGQNLLIGQAEAVDYFLKAKSSRLPAQFPGKESKALLLNGRLLMDWGKEGIKMTVYKPYQYEH